MVVSIAEQRFSAECSTVELPFLLNHAKFHSEYGYSGFSGFYFLSHKNYWRFEILKRVKRRKFVHDYWIESIEVNIDHGQLFLTLWSPIMDFMYPNFRYS